MPAESRSDVPYTNPRNSPVIIFGNFKGGIRSANIP
jgi:hypothetical protein